MKKIKENIIVSKTNYNYINNIADIKIDMEAIELLLISEIVNVEDGFVYYINEKLTFEETIIDFYFEVEHLKKSIFLFRKIIRFGFSMEGFIVHNLKYLNYVPNND